MENISDSYERIQAIFTTQKAASRAAPAPDWPTRKDRLERLARMIRENEAQITAAISADFGQRAAADTHLAEIFPCYAEITHALCHGRRWMRPRRVATALWFWPGKSRIVPQPKGLVGIIGPWNYPLMLTIGPLAGAFAAGNLAMIKASEHAPNYAAWLADTAPRYFSETELTILRGGPEVGAAFAALPFDHLFFTGNGDVGRKVMAAAAANLTPVTLELGGKSPAIVTEKADLDQAVARILTGKMLNSGQTCVAPDYLLIARPLAAEFTRRAQDWLAAHYPDPAHSADVTRIIDDRQFSRLLTLRDEALAAGAQAVPLTDQQPNPEKRFFPPVLLRDVPPHSEVLRKEIFGPILPVIPFDTLDEAIAHVAAGPRPLAAYYFTRDKAELAALSAAIISGGACYNETVMHVAQSNLPFGGVGPSGMGSYHGQHGFDTFSHLRATFIQSRFNGLSLFAPPFGRRFFRLLEMLKRMALPRRLR